MTAGWKTTGSPTLTVQRTSPVASDIARTSPVRVPTNTLPLTTAGGVNEAFTPSRPRSRVQRTLLVFASTLMTRFPMELYRRPLSTKGFEPWYAQIPWTLACPRLAIEAAIFALPFDAPAKPTDASSDWLFASVGEAARFL